MENKKIQFFQKILLFYFYFILNSFYSLPTGLPIHSGLGSLGFELWIYSLSMSGICASQRSYILFRLIRKLPCLPISLAP